MQDGNWIPISKAFAAHLPKDRPYTKLEAAFSLQKKYDEGEAVTTTGLAALWRWSRAKVMTFIKELKITIEYPEDTKNIQRQRGFLATEKKTETRQIIDRNKTETRQIKFIDSKWLSTEKDRNKTETKQIIDRSPYTDVNPNPNPNPNPITSPPVVDIEPHRMQPAGVVMGRNEFANLYYQTFGKMMSGMLNHKAADICQRYPPEKIRDALQISADAGAKSFNYKEKVLQGNDTQSDDEYRAEIARIIKEADDARRRSAEPAGPAHGRLQAEQVAAGSSSGSGYRFTE